MTAELLIGAVFGLGVYLLLRYLLPSRRGAAATVAHIDAMRAYSGQGPAVATEEHEGLLAPLRALVGTRVSEFYLRQGWEQRSLRADLAILERGWEGFLATKTLLAAAGFIFGPLAYGAVTLIGMGHSVIIPVWLALFFAVLFFFLPDAEIRRDAAEKRRDLRRVVGAYLDLVAMNLAGGRGLPEALMAAAEVSDGWALLRIRRCLTDARITGVSQWAALGRLGDELAIEELQDLSAALALVADDGAKVRDSLSARAETMRHRELSEIEGQAGARSQSMLVAQMLLCAGFMLFLMFPAVMRVIQM